MRHAGFWRRLGAYTLDIVPILLLTAMVFYLFLGFDQTWRAYRAETRSLEARTQFLVERSQIRDSVFLVWLLYSTAMEASALQGTLGKRAARIRVVGPDGERLTLARSIGRNLAKLLSYLPPGLGFLWVAFSKQKRGWHDLVAGTDVVRSEPDRKGMAG